MNEHQRTGKVADAARAIGNIFKKAATPAIRARVSVGKVVLPLHGSADNNPAQRLLHHMAMQEMAGTNYMGEPRGFRIAPSSRKNPRTHKAGATTRLEKLAKAAGMGATA